MCSVFQTGAVRLASQKSWLVAAITNRIASAISPNASNGNCDALAKRVFAVSTLTSGFTSPSAWNWNSAKLACASASANMVTPRCRRL